MKHPRFIKTAKIFGRSKRKRLDRLMFITAKILAHITKPVPHKPLPNFPSGGVLLATPNMEYPLHTRMEPIIMHNPRFDDDVDAIANSLRMPATIFFAPNDGGPMVPSDEFVAPPWYAAMKWVKVAQDVQKAKRAIINFDTTDYIKRLQEIIKQQKPKP